MRGTSRKYMEPMHCTSDCVSRSSLVCGRAVTLGRFPFYIHGIAVEPLLDCGAVPFARVDAAAMGVSVHSRVALTPFSVPAGGDISVSLGKFVSTVLRCALSLGRVLVPAA